MGCCLWMWLTSEGQMGGGWYYLDAYVKHVHLYKIHVQWPGSGKSNEGFPPEMNELLTCLIGRFRLSMVERKGNFIWYRKPTVFCIDYLHVMRDAVFNFLYKWVCVMSREDLFRFSERKWFYHSMYERWNLPWKQIHYECSFSLYVFTCIYL